MDSCFKILKDLQLEHLNFFTVNSVYEITELTDFTKHKVTLVGRACSFDTNPNLDAMFTIGGHRIESICKANSLNFFVDIFGCRDVSGSVKHMGPVFFDLTEEHYYDIHDLKKDYLMFKLAGIK